MANHQRHFCRRHFAFTLVELLVVVGIIAVLIAMLMPALTKAREMAKRAGCASNLRQNGLSLYMYAHEHKGWFPLSDFRGANFIYASNGPGYGDIPDGQLLFKRYGFSFRTLTCPSGYWEAKYWSDAWPLEINYFYNCGVGTWPSPNDHWYGHWYNYQGKFQNSSNSHDQPVPRVQMIDVQSETALMTDAYLPKNNTLWGAPTQYLIANNTATLLLPGSHLKPGQNYSAGLNVLMADGSVIWLEHAPCIEKGSPGYRDDARPRHRYRRYINNMFW